MRVAIQGMPGSNSDAAARTYYRALPSLQIAPCERFQQAFELVESGACERAFLPIENSTAGSVHRVYDLLQSQTLHIVGEYYHPIRHCLLILPSDSLAKISRVISHEQALAQCRQYIEAHNWHAEAWYDTAGAAKDLAEQGWFGTAAIAPAYAAEIYQLTIAAQGISNASENYTRFLALARQPHALLPSTTTYKTSVVFHLPQNRAGGLYKALAAFALRDIDLTKLESRPMPHTPFNYLFYLDFKGHAEQLACQRALANLSEFAADVRVLGSYPADESWVKAVMQQPTFYVRNIPIYGDAVLAPMAGYSDLPFRAITRRLGSAMSYTEFVPAAGLLQQQPALYRRLLYTAAERPITFQIFGSDVATLQAAAEQIYHARHPDIIDINMGCWAPKVAENGAGAGLLRDPQKIGQIFNALTRSLPIPITGKIRLGWDDDNRNHRLVARVLEENGAALIAVHGRTKCQAYHGAADWDAIAEVRQTVHIPVLGNGDVRCVADIARMKAHTGVPAVMIGRAAIGNPWIFQHRERWQVDSIERAAVLREHLALACDYYGAATGFKLFLRHANQYIYGVAGAAKLRAALANAATPAIAADLIAQYEHTPAMGGGVAAAEPHALPELLNSTCEIPLC